MDKESCEEVFELKNEHGWCFFFQRKYLLLYYHTAFQVPEWIPCQILKNIVLLNQTSYHVVAHHKQRE